MSDDAGEKPDFGQGVKADHIAPGSSMIGKWDENDVLIARTQDGAFYAVDANCSHAGAPLADGIIAEGQVRCPWHHARFDLVTGGARSGAAVSPIGCYDLTAENGTVRVTGKRSASREPVSKLAVETPVVIIGAGGTGYALAKDLVAAGCGADVILLSADSDAPYDRTTMSKEFLSGEMEADDCRLPALDGDLEYRGSSEVTAIDREKRALTLSGGESLSYGTLVIATGAEPLRPDFEGADHEAVHRLRSLSDARAIKKAAADAGNIAIVGASFIGLEVAASLKKDGRNIQIIDRHDIPLASVLGERIGTWVKSLHEDEGAEFITGTEVARFDGNKLHLTNGSAIEADLLVLGTGVAPRTALAEDAGLTVDADEGGLALDENLRTEDAHIYAAGDIAAYPDARFGGRVRIEHWVHAQRQGQYLARRFTGETSEPFGDTPFFWSMHYDTSINYVGHGDPGAMRVEGDVSEGDFAARIEDNGGTVALISCGRDRLSLETEQTLDTASHA